MIKKQKIYQRCGEIEIENHLDKSQKGVMFFVCTHHTYWGFAACPQCQEEKNQQFCSLLGKIVMKAPTKEQFNDPEYWVWKLIENTNRVGVETTEDGQFVKLHHMTKHVKDIIPDSYGHKIEIFNRPDQSISEEHQIISDDCLRAKIGEIGNQLYNFGCEHQNDKDLSDRLLTLSTALWDLAKHVPTEPAEPDWNGEDMPPAYIECEVFDYEKKQYSRCKTLSAATMNGERACATIKQKGHFGRLIWGVKFRPIRIKEQKECENVINKAHKVVKAAGTKSAFKALYDAKMLVMGNKQ
jgi:hypothetical protein